jgi:general stress protein YciG
LLFLDVERPFDEPGGSRFAAVECAVNESAHPNAVVEIGPETETRCAEEKKEGSLPPKAEGRGFAGMDEERRREVARMGGRAAHQKGTAHEFTSEEAREAGRKGGRAVSQNREHMSAIGREGGESRAASQTRRRAEVAIAGGRSLSRSDSGDGLESSEEI